MGLLEVLDGSLEHLDVIVAGHVLVAAVAVTLAVAHFAKDTAIGRGDALNGEQGAVGVEGGIHGGVAFQIHVLSGDLAVHSQLQSQLFGGEEAAFAVGNGDIDDIAHVHQAQPGALVGCDPGADDPALVTADGVEGQEFSLKSL